VQQSVKHESSRKRHSMQGKRARAGETSPCGPNGLLYASNHQRNLTLCC